MQHTEIAVGADNRNARFNKWSEALDNDIRKLYEENGGLRLFFQCSDDPALISVLVEIAQVKKQNANTMKNIAAYLRDISLRDEMQYSAILAAAGLHGDGDFYEKLKELRYPVWSKKKAVIARESASFKAKTGAVLETPEFAEGNSIDLRISFKTLEELMEKLEKIKKCDGIQRILDEIRE